MRYWPRTLESVPTKTGHRPPYVRSSVIPDICVVSVFDPFQTLVRCLLTPTNHSHQSVNCSPRASVNWRIRIQN